MTQKIISFSLPYIGKRKSKYNNFRPKFIKNIKLILFSRKQAYKNIRLDSTSHIILYISPENKRKTLDLSSKIQFFSLFFFQVQNFFWLQWKIYLFKRTGTNFDQRESSLGESILPVHPFMY